jgi:hypothetical protein
MVAGPPLLAVKRNLQTFRGLVAMVLWEWKNLRNSVRLAQLNFSLLSDGILHFCCFSVFSNPLSWSLKRTMFFGP